jgi:small GTP-binding protein
MKIEKKNYFKYNNIKISNSNMENEWEIIIEEVESSEVKEDYKFKVVVIGDSGVGKTNLIKRFITNTFSDNSKATVGVEFITKSYKIKNQIFKIELWDTAGQERYKSITAVYYKGAKGALVVYDTTSKMSFNNIDKWLAEIKDKTSNDLKLMIIGNKIDLKEFREVSNEQATEKAKTLGIPIMETSALDATNVKEAFNDLIREMYKDLRSKIKNSGGDINKNKGGIDLNTGGEKKKSRCC